MTRLLTVLFAFIVLGCVETAQAKTLSSTAELRPFADQLMAKISKVAFDDAGVSMKEYSPLPEEEVKALIGRIKMQMTMMLPRFGNGTGYEFIKEDKAGDSVIRLTYVSKHERHAMPWVFIFYKASNGWQLNMFFFNDNLNTLF